MRDRPHLDLNLQRGEAARSDDPSVRMYGQLTRNSIGVGRTEEVKQGLKNPMSCPRFRAQ
ncbi:hypothetical protein PAXRUDRAFT_825986 [Paxillus rubicundulus Ve08.2h10]|uniref:Uncharacterized protein n=1 Tax=Paxillus rubicundulus Ve08.2h10 TaxID=930991 RepID=A0A0D0E007_9AGAM|nr:hypothetical protein PAXRUDRAFT_825986 [Paxillus rubicundulus Ve08.2h10]